MCPSGPPNEDLNRLRGLLEPVRIDLPDTAKLYLKVAQAGSAVYFNVVFRLAQIVHVAGEIARPDFAAKRDATTLSMQNVAFCDLGVIRLKTRRGRATPSPVAVNNDVR